jgi:hypothetical protein
MSVVYRAGGNRRATKEEENPEPGCGRGKPQQAVNHKASSYWQLMPISNKAGRCDSALS